VLQELGVWGILEFWPNGEMALHDYPWLMAGIALPLKELLMKPGTHHVGRLGDGYGSWCLQYGYAYGSTPIAQECRSNGQVGASCVALVSIPDGVTGPVWSPSSFERFKVEREAIRSRNKSCMLPEILSSGFRIKIPPGWRENVMKRDSQKGGSFAWSTSVGLPFQNQ
jgi:hypothetical protein